VVCSLPLHAPLAVQEVAFEEDQLNVVGCPTKTLVGEAEMFTVGVGLVTVKAAEELALPPAPVQVRV
jgi:hypothetical protein